MPDILLNPTADGGELTMVNGNPQMTDGLSNAVYLSLIGGPYWGNAIAGSKGEKYTSDLVEIMRDTLTNKARLNAIEASRRALDWLINDGIVASIDVEAEIPSAARLYLRITITRPSGETEFLYSLNWDAQEVEQL